DLGPEPETESEDKPMAKGTIPAPPRPGTAREPKPADLFAAQAKEAKALLDRLKAADPGRAAPLMAQYATALGHAKDGRYEQALGSVGEVDGLAKSALRAVEAAREIKGAATSGDPVADWQRRVDAITPDFKAFLQKGGDAANAAKLKFSEANLFYRK